MRKPTSRRSPARSAGAKAEAICDLRFGIRKGSRQLLLLVANTLLINGCSAPYDVKLSDDKSASNGPLFFFGWADPPLLPGTRLADAPFGSRVVIWNEAGLEAIVDLGETCPVLVRGEAGARPPTELELEVIASVFPSWPTEASGRVAEYASERRLERRFPSDLRAHAESLAPADLVDFAAGEGPAGWMALGGRAFAWSRAAALATSPSLPRVVDGALLLRGEDRRAVAKAILARPELGAGELVRLASAEPDLAVAHASADEAVCLAAIDAVARAPLSSARREGLLKILASPGVTAKVCERALEVPLSYPEDRAAVQAAANGPR